MDLRIGEKKKIMQFHEQKLETGEANKQSTKCRSKKINKSTQATFHTLINVLRCSGKPKMYLKRASRKNQDMNTKNEAQKTD